MQVMNSSCLWGTLVTDDYGAWKTIYLCSTLANIVSKCALVREINFCIEVHISTTCNKVGWLNNPLAGVGASPGFCETKPPPIFRGYIYYQAALCGHSHCVVLRFNLWSVNKPAWRSLCVSVV